MAVISTGNHPKALWPGIKAWWGLKYSEYTQEWKEIFDSEDSDKAYEEDVEATGFGLAPVKDQGSATKFDTESQGHVTRYTNVAYSLGYIVTLEERDDNQYEYLSKRRSEGLAFSMRQTKEIVHANILNRAFNTSYAPTGETGVALCSTSHATLSGNQANKPSTDADLSEAALEDALIAIALFKNSRGLQIALQGKKLIVPPQYVFRAQRILKSEARVGTANNDINAIRSMMGQGMLSEGYTVNHYLTDTNAWFIKTNAPRGLIHKTRKAIEFSMDNDFDTSNAKAKAYERYTAGCTDFRGVYGSAGST